MMILNRDGILLCSRYSYPPNSLHYCGPPKERDLLGYIQEQVPDVGLVEILNHFDTLYKYLVLIASANAIADPFDRRVVEAYWLGNSLLRNVRRSAFVGHLTDSLSLKKKLPLPAFHRFLDKSADGIPHHNFHVFNIFLRTGHLNAVHTLETMDQCRISWGEVIEEVPRDLLEPSQKQTPGKQYLVMCQPLEVWKGKLELGTAIVKVVTSVLLTPRPRDVVTIHWGQICDIISPAKKRELARYTSLSLSFTHTREVI